MTGQLNQDYSDLFMEKESMEKESTLIPTEAMPQKLGLDVVVDRLKGELVTLEVNGLFSGYQGMNDLGYFPEKRIITKIGQLAEGGSILVHPDVLEFRDSATRRNFKALRRRFNTEIIFSPFITQVIFQEELEEILNQPLASFQGIIGLEKYLITADGYPLTGDNPLPNRMINRPLLEFLTANKYTQYLVLGKIPELNLPETIIADEELNYFSICDLAAKYGKLVQKPLTGCCGQGVGIIKEKSLNQLLQEMFKNYTAQGLSSGNGKAIRSNWQIRRLMADNPEEAKFIAQERFLNSGVVVQRYVETMPVISQETGQPHFARARLLWFGEYLGGYWALSKEPITDSSESNLIVNYCNTRKAQRFTEQEEEIFNEYANTVFPKIIQAARGLESSVVDFENKIVSQYLNALAGNLEPLGGRK